MCVAFQSAFLQENIPKIKNKKIFIKKKQRKLQVLNFNENSIKKKESGETKK